MSVHLPKHLALRAACPVGAPVRKLTQRASGSLVMGLSALTEEFVPPLERLAEWFAMVTNSESYETTYKDTDHAEDVILRLYVGSA